MDTAQAFAAYQAARARLPAAPRQGAAIRAENLAAIAGNFDAFLLDAFGVLNIGEAAIPGVVQRLADLKAAGKTLLVVSNAASAPHEALMGKYAALGYDFAPEDVVTSRKTMLAALEDQPARHWGIMSARGMGLGELTPFSIRVLDDDPADYDWVEAFLLVGASGWTEDRQRLLEDSLRRNPRPVWVANPDIVAPREHGFSLEPGFYAHRLADATGVVPVFFGKPFGNIFDQALALLPPGTPKQRVLMVGDSPHTDILGASAAGIRSALVAGYGFLNGADPGPYLAEAAIQPDFILDRP